jgi:hypothetical protein
LGNPKNNREGDMNLQHQIFHNIKSEGDLYGVVMVIVLQNRDGFFRQFLGGVRDAAVTSEEKIKQAAEHVRDLIKK